ncbi:MAG: hypothetical protein IKW76_06435, partial [Clostridia bacterium]|nr:hypothetical protein [Clostridia bacterium]
TPAFDFTALQTFGAGQIDGMLLTGNAAVPTVEGYADVVLADVLRVDCDDAESFRRNPALIGKAARITMPEGLSLTLIFTVTEPFKQMSVFRLGENGTVRLDAERSGDELRVPLTESGVYFVMNTNKLLTLLGVTGGSLQHAGSNRILLDDFHYVTLNAPLNESSDTDTDGDGVPDREEVGEAHAIDLGDGIEITAYAFRSDPTLPDTDFDGIPDTYDNAPTSNVFTGKMKSGHDGTTTVSFTVDYRNFFGDNTTYHPELASFSIMGAALAYYAADYSNAYFTFDTAQTWENGTASKVHGIQLMQVFGYEDVVDYTLDSYGDDDLCEILIGHKTVIYQEEIKVIVAIWVRGTDSKSLEEWSSNFHMGDLVRFFDEYDSVAGKSPRQKNDDWTRKTNHRGFDVCATRILKFVEDYYTTTVKPVLNENPSYSLAYWITGHSRGAAVGNLIASYLIDLKNELYAYTFATPYNTANTEASAEKYDCIFNLVNSNDFVPMLPMPEWGFTRYGKTAEVDASQWAAEIKTTTGETYSGKYLAASDMNTLLGKFICITGENADRNNPGKLLGWREVYVYHCGHTHEGETVGNYQSTTYRSGETNNNYTDRLKKYSYTTNGGMCQTPAFDLQVLVEVLAGVGGGSTFTAIWDFLTKYKLADKFDFGKGVLDMFTWADYATKLTEPHYMDTYSVIQSQINAAGNPGARFLTLPYYTQNSNGSRPPHTHTYTYVAYEGQEPTCTEEGFGYRYCLCSEANEDFYD